MIFGSTIDGLKKKGELDDSEFGTLDVGTGSSRSTVASEETDVGVMFKGNVDITGISVGSLREFTCGCTDHQHCTPVVGAGGGEAVVKRSESLELVDIRCDVNPKINVAL